MSSPCSFSGHAGCIIVVDSDGSDSEGGMDALLQQNNLLSSAPKLTPQDQALLDEMNAASD
eukprot:4265197-Pleurochrysis_carterae.AAC.1